MNIDYSAFNQPVTKNDIEAFKKSQAKPQSKVLLVAGIFLGVIMAPFFISIVYDFFVGNPVTITHFFFVMLTVAIFALFYLYSDNRLRLLTVLYKFSAANNLKLVYDVVAPNYAGVIFSRGHSRRINEALLFPDGSEMGNYAFTTGSGKNQTTHIWAYARVKLARRLPHMLLDAKKNNFFGKFSSLPIELDKSQILKLEGNFNEHFTLYVPKQYERDALYVFTPDVMATVIDAGKAYDIEIVDDTLFLYATEPLDLRSESQLSELIKVIGTLGSELHEQTDYYADERVGDRAMNVIAEPGRRLSRSVGIVTIIFVIIYTLIVLLQISGAFMDLLR